MTLLRWTYEGQTNGVAPASGNVASFGDPAMTPTISAGSTCTYSNAHPAFGTMGLVLTAPATETVVLRTGAFTATAALAFQAYIYLTAYPTVNFAVAQWRTSGGNQFSAQLDTLGRMYLVDNSGTSPVTLLRTAVIPLNTTYRYDAFASIGTTAGNSTFKHRLVKLADATQLDEQTSTTANLNNAAATPAMLVTGQHGKPNSAGAIAGMYLDSVAWQDGAADYITPPSSTLTLTATPAPTSGTAPLAVTLTLAPTGGTGTTITYVIDWGDGSTNTTTTSTSASHTYTSPATYTGTVTATNA